MTNPDLEPLSSVVPDLAGTLLKVGLKSFLATWSQSHKLFGSLLYSTQKIVPEIQVKFFRVE